MPVPRYPIWLALGLLLPIWVSGCSLAPLVVLGSPPQPDPLRQVCIITPPSAPSPLPTRIPPPATPTATPPPPATPTPSTNAWRAPPAAPTRTSQPSPTTISLRMRQHIFEKVWRTVDEHYLYPDFRGVDWQAVWREFAPRVRAASSNEQFYALMGEMIGRLDDHHSRFLAPQDVVAEDVLTVGREAHVGIGVITAPDADGAIIQHVFSNSPAASAGLRPRDRIVAIDGTPFAAGGDITGRAGTQVRLTVLRPDERLREIVLTRRHVEGRISPTAQRLGGDIGYLRITTLWVTDMDDQVSGALTDMVVERPLKGLILDMRGNPGGWRDVLTSVLGHFVQGTTGFFYSRQQTRPLTIRETSGPDLRDLPLVVLIDQQTASYAEVLVAILQAEADAHVIGMPSSGNTETIYAYEVTGGARLWVAQEGFRLRNGTNLEDRGVQPDHTIDVDWARYSQEKDPHILEARAYLRQRSSAASR